MKFMNKKGAEGVSVLGVVVAVILLVIVLLILVLFVGKGSGGFSDLWSNFWGGNQVNVDNVVSGCNSACEIGRTTDYCDYQRAVIFEPKGKKEMLTCPVIAMRIPDKLGPCEKISCNTQTLTCLGLDKECAGIEPAGKCKLVGWVDKASLDGYKANVGTGKTYKEVVDLTGRVTDVADRDANKDKFCVKLVEN